MFKINAILLGRPLTYQTCVTEEASSINPIRWRRTLDSITSTPQRSQIIPLYRTRLYLPQWHSQSFTGPKILSQNNPPISGLRVL